MKNYTQATLKILADIKAKKINKNSLNFLYFYFYTAGQNNADIPIEFGQECLKILLEGKEQELSDPRSNSATLNLRKK